MKKGRKGVGKGAQTTAYMEKYKSHPGANWLSWDFAMRKAHGLYKAASQADALDSGRGPEVEYLRHYLRHPKVTEQ